MDEVLTALDNRIAGLEQELEKMRTVRAVLAGEPGVSLGRLVTQPPTKPPPGKAPPRALLPRKPREETAGNRDGQRQRLREYLLQHGPTIPKTLAINLRFHRWVLMQVYRHPWFARVQPDNKKSPITLTEMGRAGLPPTTATPTS